MTALNIQYANRDKAKKSFGYIGISFLVSLFGSIFLNDFIKLCIYYLHNFREWWRKTKAQRVNETQKEHVTIKMDNITYGDDLEEKLEKVFFKLVEVNSKRRRYIEMQA